MEQKKEVLQDHELEEVKAGTDPDGDSGKEYCPDYNTCPYASAGCYYQYLPGGYMIPCKLV